MNIDFFVAGLLFLCSTLLLWFVSPLKITLAKIFFKKDILLPTDFDDIVSIKAPLVGKLIGCWICTSFWISLALGCLFVVMGQPLHTPLVTFLGYPGLAYIFKTIIKV